MRITKNDFPESQHKALKEYCFKVIGCMQNVHKALGLALPEYIYQEALYNKLKREGYDVRKEYRHHPIYEGIILDSFLRLDLLVVLERGNIIIECKSIAQISDREQLQLFGYMSATKFPIGILVNFGSYPKAQIERYVLMDDSISAF